MNEDCSPVLRQNGWLEADKVHAKLWSFPEAERGSDFPDIATSGQDGYEVTLFEELSGIGKVDRSLAHGGHHNRAPRQLQIGHCYTHDRG